MVFFNRLHTQRIAVERNVHENGYELVEHIGIYIKKNPLDKPRPVVIGIVEDLVQILICNAVDLFDIGLLDQGQEIH